ncbi:retropepsin-like aspartic protease [Desulfonema magnum]|uniref:Aspartyl protease domain-containing protein n=1 Tax=Desulfonema magnum TaxID=45655 RepID=A0A975BQ90_9BACT|nr:retropepsin-like aspartic protease [Desulfonema magnum]QTA89570.1 Aspartyl protease domain-containing protein [Desulfonema magnum]
MNLIIQYNLPFISIQAGYRSLSIEISNILVDTGSATTILNADILSTIGVKPEADDTTAQIVGIGGEESVYNKVMEFIKVEDKVITDFKIDVGLLDYGFEINGILGMDFLMKASAIIDLHRKIILF